MTFVQLRKNITLILALIYFVFMGMYTKRFAVLHINLGIVPVYVSDFLLLAVIALRADHLLKLGKKIPRSIIFFFTFFLLWGGVRFILSIVSGSIQEFGLMEIVKQTAIFYQGLWILVGLAFHKKELQKIYSYSLFGLGIGQAIGWLGFFLMGRFSNGETRLIGYPVGNEAILPFYFLSVFFWPSWKSFLYMTSFGLIWLTQFLIYMKRNWIVAMIFFALPPLFLLSGKKLKKNIYLIFGALLAGMVLAYITLQVVSGREEPIYYHISEGKLAAGQRENFSNTKKITLSFFDYIYQSFDSLRTDVSVKEIIFKGDMLRNNVSLMNPGSMMAFRLHLWRQTWEKFLHHPIIGEGFGPHCAETQLNGSPAIADGKWISGPHNSYLGLLHRMGIIGGILFLVLNLLIIQKWLVRKQQDKFFIIIFFSYLSMCFFSFFNVSLENPQSGMWFWLFLGILLNNAIEDRQEV